MHWSIAPIPFLFSLTFAQRLLPTDECPLLGPTFSSDFDFSKTVAFARAKAGFPAKIEALLKSELISNSSSFLIDVYSTITNTSLYTYTYEAEAPLLNETYTAGKIDDETIFRVGSVSKLFTVYAILVTGGGLGVLDYPVTRFLPELIGNADKDPLTHIKWEDVTIGALANQLSGSGQFRKFHIRLSYTHT